MKIEADVPMPERNTNQVWPFPQMKVGDSFEVPTNMNRRVKNAACSFERSHAGMKFAVRKVGDTWRIWRTA